MTATSTWRLPVSRQMRAMSSWHLQIFKIICLNLQAMPSGSSHGAVLQLPGIEVLLRIVVLRKICKQALHDALEMSNTSKVSESRAVAHSPSLLWCCLVQSQEWHEEGIRTTAAQHEHYICQRRRRI